MEMAMAELEPEKGTRCEPVASRSRRRAPDFSRSGGGRAGGPEEVGRGWVVGGCG